MKETEDEVQRLSHQLRDARKRLVVPLILMCSEASSLDYIGA
jgi:hypothetical protein